MSAERDLGRICGAEVMFHCGHLGEASDPVVVWRYYLCLTWQVCGLITNQNGNLILFSFVSIYLLLCLFVPFLSFSFLSAEKVQQNPQYLSFKARVLRSLRLSLTKSIERVVESYGKNPFVIIIKGHSKLDWQNWNDNGNAYDIQFRQWLWKDSFQEPKMRP